MAELSIFEKQPGSFRLDHPDFSDVAKTTFAKGVIEQVKMLTPKIIDDFGNAVAVFESLAKVNIGGEVTGYLPLFYHPKKLYWDTNTREATEFNQDKGYFENAWMSFRGGDEVIVMLADGIPKRILGFADGKPRLGEIVAQMHTQAYNISGHGDYPASDSYYVLFDIPNESLAIINTGKGLDGKSLGLVSVDDIVDTIIPAGIISDSYEATQYLVWSPWSNPPQWLTYDIQLYLFEFYFVVGPAIFFVQSLSSGDISSKEGYYPLGSTSRAYVGPFTEEFYNQIRSGGAGAAAVFQAIKNYFLVPEAPPPEIKWGTNLPSAMQLLWNYYSAVGGIHPLARPSWYLRPHNP